MREGKDENLGGHFLFLLNYETYLFYTYFVSVPKPFIGDYVRIRQNSQWKKAFYYESDQHVVFADVVNKIARATGKVSTWSVLLIMLRI